MNFEFAFDSIFAKKNFSYCIKIYIKHEKQMNKNIFLCKYDGSEFIFSIMKGNAIYMIFERITRDFIFDCT